MKALLIITVAAMTAFTTSCNTFIGIGRDMRIAGEGVEKLASKASGKSTSSSNPDHSGAPVY